MQLRPRNRPINSTGVISITAIYCQIRRWILARWRKVSAQTRSPFRVCRVGEGAKKGQRCSVARYDTRISKGSRCCTPLSSRSDGGRGLRRTDDSPPRELAEHEEAGQRRTVAANRRRPRPPINPRVCAPQVSRRFPTSPSVRVPRARPQTYHFFGDSRRGNILVLALYPRSLLPSLRPFASPPETDDSKSPLELASPGFPNLLFNSPSFERLILINLSRATLVSLYLFVVRVYPVSRR